MNKVFRQSALALLVLSLVGCGLKGPLYFPPENTPAPAKQVQQQTNQTQQQSSPAKTQ
ncbi:MULTISPECIES: LPS translocon maturation chaperone LptM [Musicola]|uniref:LPS-assembly lipoprotein LptM n=1 Tax=Musicola paradisiaca (strain Ech703) TaxID=579405 RepID=C6C7D0_MUSP7|nr:MULTISPECIES: lipoprotein [Musicola]ACS84048.1 conserved hypothetical protein [Musicola paradisiaca Ech703]